jgi:hypothetical protein
MDEPPDLLGRCAGESGLTATFANLRGDVLDEHTAATDCEHFAHELVS